MRLLTRFYPALAGLFLLFLVACSSGGTKPSLTSGDAVPDWSALDERTVQDAGDTTSPLPDLTRVPDELEETFLPDVVEVAPELVDAVVDDLEVLDLAEDGPADIMPDGPPTPCLSSKDCEDDMVCNKELGICVDCVEDVDCEEDEHCDAAGHCVPFVTCDSDKDCKALDMVCDLESGMCVECVADVDCADEQFCLNNLCLPDLCEPGELLCQDGAVWVCTDNGGKLVHQQTCGENEYCMTGECHAQVCAPDQPYCDEDVLRVCDSLGSGPLADEYTDCVALGRVCVEGECVCIPATCESLALECGQWEDGCGGQVDCGPCPDNHECQEGSCVCIPNCAEKECGDDGCGGTCGQCPEGESCLAGACLAVCGDLLCHASESMCSCPQDCGHCFGCCLADECLEGTEGAACGKDGAPCLECGPGQTCVGQVCLYVCGDNLCSPEGNETCTTCPADCGECPTTPGFALIPAGSFWMGSPAGQACPVGYQGAGCTGDGTGNTIPESGRDADEILHKVTLTRDFEMMILPVTQQQWKEAFGNWNPSAHPYCGNQCPVENMSWYSALAYANWKSLQEGLTPCYSLTGVLCTNGASVGSSYMSCMTASALGIGSASVGLQAGKASPYGCDGYRLPMEAEWEYAVRAGTDTAFYDGQEMDGSHAYCQMPFHLTDIAWYCANSPTTPVAVGQKTGNAFGLQDMTGNVWEWVWDWLGPYAPPYTDPETPYAGSSGYRVRRGGAYESYGKYCRSANRGGGYPGQGYPPDGFRLVRTLP